ncbi:hypothetical protein GT370_12535 [Acidocella sp. MX-AZ03]|uniref:FAD-binding domain-containing protein n=1 Tax=Acidocella sp. MX-AZ03 TaxID=2697363 RepID=UPI0022DE0774|nr:FAD-binding domain-containing protein [Acidocella sp. MX-AZ03]WBO58085.1 hypothetical protein GT370_12535 [Acidocella sp. MX-AZ03]
MTFNQPAINGIFSPPPPIREAGLARLAAFTPRAGRAYAAGRNTDPGPGAPSAVSGLSPYLRHRLVSEVEVISAVIARHGAGGAEKFIQEVFWRIYWKGWLELRPALWTSYRQRLAALREDAALMPRAVQAMRGETGIGCFDAWARELAQTGTLHNHTRMWFASIWCFTLKLPWLLGADFFFQHLLDADAASNLLSWRWVAGCQTPNKPYIARAANIAHYSNGRFAPYGVLNEAPEPVAEPNPPPMQTLPAIDDLPGASSPCCCMRMIWAPGAGACRHEYRGAGRPCPGGRARIWSGERTGCGLDAGGARRQPEPGQPGLRPGRACARARRARRLGAGCGRGGGDYTLCAGGVDGGCLARGRGEAAWRGASPSPPAPGV